MASQHDQGEANADVPWTEGASGVVHESTAGCDGLQTAWPTKKPEAIALKDGGGEPTGVVLAPVMEMEGLIMPTELHYVVQHFGVPEPVRIEDWTLTVDGEVKRPLELSFEELRRFPGRTIRMVMECSGSDAGFFEFFKGEGPSPSRTRSA